MKVIGLTGGVGAGKSTVVDIMKRYFPVEFIHCDAIGHEVMEPGQPAYNEILLHFGASVLNEDGTIHRGRLYEAAFPTGRVEELNSCIHPKVKEEVAKRLSTLREQRFSGFAVIEAALLIEAGYREICDEYWYVYAPEETRRQRLKENRGYSEEKTEGIMEQQAKEAFFIKNCDFIIRNDSDKEHCEQNIFQQIKKHLEEEQK